MVQAFFQFSQADGFVDGVGGVQAVREGRPVADPVFKEAAVVGLSGDNGRTGLASLLSRALWMNFVVFLASSVSSAKSLMVICFLPSSFKAFL